MRVGIVGLFSRGNEIIDITLRSSSVTVFSIRKVGLKRRMIKTALFFIAVLLAAGLHAQADEQWQHAWRGSDQAHGAASSFLSDDDKRIIRSYFRDADQRTLSNNRSKVRKKSSKKNLPLGLRKKLERGGELPPGWQKKIARGEVLDAGLYRQSRSLPEALLNRLSTDLDGTELRLLDDRVVRIIDDTRMILDVLSVY